jgi:hypothetical protein
MCHTGKRKKVGARSMQDARPAFAVKFYLHILGYGRKRLTKEERRLAVCLWQFIFPFYIYVIRASISAFNLQKAGGESKTVLCGSA